jgi:hypothetical protein
MPPAETWADDTSAAFVVLGNMALRAFTVVADWDHDRLGLAEAPLAYNTSTPPPPPSAAARPRPAEPSGSAVGLWV